MKKMTEKINIDDDDDCGQLGINNESFSKIKTPFKVFSASLSPTWTQSSIQLTPLKPLSHMENSNSNKLNYSVSNVPNVEIQQQGINLESLKYGKNKLAIRRDIKSSDAFQTSDDGIFFFIITLIIN